MSSEALTRDELLSKNAELEKRIMELEKRLSTESSTADVVITPPPLIKTLIESIDNLSVFMVDRENRYVFVAQGPKMKTLTGYDPELMLGKKIDEVFPPEISAEKIIVNENIFKSGQRVIREFGLPGKGKEKIWLELADFPVKNSAGEVIFVVNTIKDIREQKRVELSLRNLPDVSSKIIEHNPYSIMVFDKDGYYIKHNPACAKLTGFDKTGIEPPKEYNVFEDELAKRHEFQKDFQALKAGKLPHLFQEAWYNYGDVDLDHPELYPGQVVFAGITAFPVTNEDSEIEYFVFMTEDKTQQKLAEIELQKSEDKYKSLVENAPVGIISFDKKGNVIEFNNMLLKIFSVPDKQQMRAFNLLESNMLKERGIVADFIKCLENGNLTINENYLPTFNGKEAYLRYHFTPSKNESGEIEGLQVLVEDMTLSREAEDEMANLEKMLRQAQKLETIGTLAGGIAHDFNNILNIIVWSSESAKMDLEEADGDLDSIDRILSAASRARDLVKQILTFSRQSEPERHPIKLHHLVNEAVDFLRASLPKSVDIQCNLDHKAGTILADPSQIHQIVMNLGTNAFQALKDGTGRIAIDLTQKDFFSKDQDNNLQNANGKFVRLTVADNGIGMDTNTRERMFDPFFTTKEKERGTGLGLSVVHGIVEGHDGFITVDSYQGNGTTINVFFPIYEQKTQMAVDDMVQEVPRGNEHILLVDDEQVILDSGVKLLDNLGYKVTAIQNPKKALEFFRKNHLNIDLLIVDHHMPEISGEKLADELRKIVPELPIILMTGYLKTVTAFDDTSSSFNEMIRKPIELNTLASTLRQVLDVN